jgi:hypothetical protein
MNIRWVDLDNGRNLGGMDFDRIIEALDACFDRALRRSPSG